MEHRPWHLGGLVLVIVFLATRAARENARITTVVGGESFIVNCLTDEKDADSMYLYQRMESQNEVLYYFAKTDKCTPEGRYKDRVKIQGEISNLSVTITNTTDDDSGLYWCSYKKIQGLNVKEFNSSITLVVVDADLKPCPAAEPVLTPSLWVTTAICAGSVLFLNIIILIICLGPKVKKACAQKKNRQYNEIYEDMRQPSISGSKPLTSVAGVS